MNQTPDHLDADFVRLLDDGATLAALLNAEARRISSVLNEHTPERAAAAERLYAAIEAAKDLEHLGVLDYDIPSCEPHAWASSGYAERTTSNHEWYAERLVAIQALSDEVNTAVNALAAIFYSDEALSEVIGRPE